MLPFYLPRDIHNISHASYQLSTFVQLPRKQHVFRIFAIKRPYNQHTNRYLVLMECNAHFLAVWLGIKHEDIIFQHVK